MAAIAQHYANSCPEGHDNRYNPTLCSTELYDPATNTWVQLPRMKGGFEPCCTVFQGKLLAMSGNYIFFCVECLELENVEKGWSDWPSMRKEEIPAKGRLTSAYSADDHVFVVRENGSLDSFDGQDWHLGLIHLHSEIFCYSKFFC